VFVFLKDIPTFVYLNKLVIFSYFWTIVREGCPSFFFFLWFVPGFFFCVVFVGSAYVQGFVGSYYFLRLVVLMCILFVSSLVLMGESVFW
jgi:hypothetical protein